jgi:hypothetical protein
MPKQVQYAGRHWRSVTDIPIVFSQCLATPHHRLFDDDKDGGFEARIPAND